MNYKNRPNIEALKKCNFERASIIKDLYTYLLYTYGRLQNDNCKNLYFNYFDALLSQLLQERSIAVIVGYKNIHILYRAEGEKRLFLKL